MQRRRCLVHRIYVLLIGNVIARLEKLNIRIEFGPVIIPGAVGQMESIFIRDPDQNLIELAYYL
ncbi:Virulence protein [Piscirickettsiaceae bacterium NZ-RLO1]|nr:Virulence protein [Piscirickettsiaceae bacterium NZ-RLO1]